MCNPNRFIFRAIVGRRFKVFRRLAVRGRSRNPRYHIFVFISGYGYSVGCEAVLLNALYNALYAIACISYTQAVYGFICNFSAVQIRSVLRSKIVVPSCYGRYSFLSYLSPVDNVVIVCYASEFRKLVYRKSSVSVVVDERRGLLHPHPCFPQRVKPVITMHGESLKNCSLNHAEAIYNGRRLC